MSATSEKLSRLIRQLFYVLFFVTPLILWPFTSEVFEFNKMMFVYLLTILIASVWAIKSALGKKLEIAKTPLDIPILLFLASQIISTIISINPHTSLWGYYSRFHGGLVSTISYITLFYAFVTHFKSESKAIKNITTCILTSAVLISVYAVLERMGIDKNIWVQDVQSRVFSTLGQPNWLSAFLAALLPLSLFQITNSEKGNHRFLHLGLSTLFLIAISFTRSQSGIAATGLVLLIFAVITAIQKKKSLLLLLFIPLLALVLIFKGTSVRNTLASLNKINPFYSDTLTIINKENETRIGGSDSMTIRRVVWEGAIKLGLKYPFFGTGVETFGYSYYWVRSAAHNLTSEANFLYNKAHNEYLNFLATTGFVGLISYLSVIGVTLYIFLNKKTKHNSLRFPLLTGYLSILITNYFGFSVVNIALFFFLFPAIYLSTLERTSLRSRTLKLGPTLTVFIISVISLWTLIGLRRMWLADINFVKGKSSLEASEKAIKLNPREPIYYAQLGSIQALLAVKYIAPQIAELPSTASAEIKQQANSILEEYINKGVANINQAIALNPFNLNIYKIKAQTYIEYLSKIDPQYNMEALSTLMKISELSPNESSNYQNIGLLYLSLEDEELSQKALEKALELNPSSQQAKYFLDQIK